MRKVIYHLVVIAIGVLAFQPVHAQTGSTRRPEPPSGPLVAQPPEFSKVIVTYTYSNERAAKAAGKTVPPDSRTRTMTITRTKDIIQQEMVDGLDGKTECWHVGNRDFSKGQGADAWGEAQQPSKTAGQIPQLDWISRENYVGSIKYANRDCLIFIQGAPANFDIAQTMTEGKIDSFHYVAFIDKETRLPVEDHNFGDYRYFHFGSAPTGMLALPPDLIRQIKADQVMLDAMNRRDPTP